MRPAKKTTDPGRGGFALVSVLWILAILTVMSIGFAGRAMLERRMAWYALDREQAQQMARAATERGLFELRHKLILDAYDNQAGYTGLDQHWARRIDLYSEAAYFEGGSEAAEGNVCEVQIEDVERRISLQGASKEILEGLKTLNARSVSHLLDLRRPSTEGYQPAFLHSIEELHELQRFSAEEWEGDAATPGLADLLTVWGDPGDGLINVNTASGAVLQSLPDMKPEIAQKIIDLRNGPDAGFSSLAEMSSKLDVSAERLLGITRYCKADSRFFTIKAHASRRRGKINAYCTVTVDLNGATPVILAWREGADGA